MATQTWLGNAAPLAQITTLTPAVPSANDTFTVTCNSKAVSYVTAAGTVADVCNGLANALANTSFAEFKEFTPQNTGTTIVLTCNTAGLPFTVATSVTTSGSATFTQATGTAATGPNDWGNIANWSNGTVPANGDDVYVSTGSVPILYGLAQASVTLDSLNVSQAFTGTIGLPTVNAKGGYREYRTKELQIGATTINIGTGGTGSGSGRMKLNTGSVAGTLNVFNTGQPADTENPALIWHGTASANVVNVNKGSMGIAFFPGDTATVATLRTGYVANQNGDVQLVCGSGCTLTTIVMDGGTVAINSGATTITNYAGILTVWAGAITTLNVYGTVYFNTTGTLGTLNLYGTFDTSQDQQAKTITNTVAAYQGALLNDPYKVIGSLVVKCNGFNDLSNLELGENATLSRS